METTAAERRLAAKIGAMKMEMRPGAVERVHEGMRRFESGATRSAEGEKPDFSGFLSAWALRLFGRYMTQHQTQANGEKRSANNWKKGMPQERYMASLSRHVQDLSMTWDRVHLYGESAYADFEEALGGVLFNALGLAHEHEREKDLCAAAFSGESPASAAPAYAEGLPSRAEERQFRDAYASPGSSARGPST